MTVIAVSMAFVRELSVPTLFFYGAGVCALLLLSGCQESVCGGAASSSSTAPSLSDFFVAQSDSSDPWQVVLGVRFTDADGDLAGGSVQLYVNGTESAGAGGSLVGLFEQSGLASSATTGAFALPLRFGEGITNGTELEIAAQLSDAAGQRSNCYAITLHFEVAQNGWSPKYMRQCPA